MNYLLTYLSPQIKMPKNQAARAYTKAFQVLSSKLVHCSVLFLMVHSENGTKLNLSVINTVTGSLFHLQTTTVTVTTGKYQTYQSQILCFLI